MTIGERTVTPGLPALNLIQIPGLFLIILFEREMPDQVRHDIRFQDII